MLGRAAWLGGVVLLSGCEEVVVESLPVARIEISPAAITLLEGEEVAVTAVLRGPGGEVLGGREVSWSTGGQGVAELPGQGRILGIAPGTTELRVRSDGVEATAPVTVLEGPSLSLSTSAVILEARRGTDAEPQAMVAVTNSGNGVLADLTAQVSGLGGEAVTWLQAELSAAAAPSELRLRAQVDTLAPGTHEAQVRVDSPMAGRGSRSVHVTLHLQDALPSIGLAPGSLAFGANAGSFEPASQAVQVANLGGGTLDRLRVQIILEAGTTVNWLTASLARSRTPTTLDLEASARMLAPGTYRARVRVSSTVATPAEVDVTFNVSAGGLIHDLRAETPGDST